MQMVMMMMVINIYLTLFTRTSEEYIATPCSIHLPKCDKENRTDSPRVLLYILRSYLSLMLFCSTSGRYGGAHDAKREQEQHPTNIVLFGASTLAKQKQRFGESCCVGHREQRELAILILKQGKHNNLHPPLSLVSSVKFRISTWLSSGISCTVKRQREREGKEGREGKRVDNGNLLFLGIGGGFTGQKRRKLNIICRRNALS